MGFYLAFNIEGDQQMSRSLQILADKVSDWTPAFQDTGDMLTTLFSGEVFDTQGGVIDEAWASLSPNYAKQKSKKFAGKGILEATGAMRGGFVSFPTSNSVTIMNQIDYFKYHQSNQPRSKIPRRVMIKLAEQQREEVVKLFQGYFQQMIAA